MLIRKDKSKLMRFLNVITWPFLRGKFLNDIWTTWGKDIYYPCDFSDDSMASKAIYAIAHEKVHVKQFEYLGKLGFLIWYFLLPLPFFFSGRWWLEKDAYLIDLSYYMSLGYTKENAVNMIVDHLSGFYFRPWPKYLMKEWFMKQ